MVTGLIFEQKAVLCQYPKKVIWEIQGIIEAYLYVIAAKIYNKMILNRIRPHLDPLLRLMNQNGFRSGRSTLTQILALRRLIEGIKAKRLQAVITFVDFCKAFDSIHGGKLMEILLTYGVPSRIVKAINILYQDTVAEVLTPDGDTEFFEAVAIL